MNRKSSFTNLMRRLHANERGAVSIETILIIGAVAIPILIFLLKFGWPKIKDYFEEGMTDLESSKSNVTSGR